MAKTPYITIARFWSRVNVRDEDECWPWMGSRSDTGYGRFRVPDSVLPTASHRFAWETANNAEVPKGLFVLHKCDNPPCCNPEHLWIGTHADNMADAVSKGRMANGTRNGNGKLSDEQVAAILSDARTGAAVAREYGVSQALVSMIRKGSRR